MSKIKEVANEKLTSFITNNMAEYFKFVRKRLEHEVRGYTQLNLYLLDNNVDLLDGHLDLLGDHLDLLDGHVDILDPFINVLINDQV